jgi:hypothetical protein
MAEPDRWGVHPCSIEDCPERRVFRGWCSMHYERWRRLGDPLAPVRGYRRYGEAIEGAQPTKRARRSQPFL